MVTQSRACSPTQLSILTINTPSEDAEPTIHTQLSSRCKQHTMQVLIACCFFSLLLTCANAGICSIPPLPSLDTNTMLSKLQPHLEQLDQKVEDALREDNSTGGLVLSIVYRNETIWTKGYGLINISGQLSSSLSSNYVELAMQQSMTHYFLYDLLLSKHADPSRGAPNANTGFRIGSVTKSLTALMMLMLRDSKKLRSLDDDITEYLPEFSIINPFNSNRGITIRQLLSHMSGLPQETPCSNSSIIILTGCDLSYKDIYKNLASLELMYPPGQQPVYSNLGFALLGRVVEKITNDTWEHSIKKMVFDPLGMTTSGNTFTPDDIKKLALGYYENKTQAGKNAQ